MELEVHLQHSEIIGTEQWNELQAHLETLDIAPKCIVKYLQEWPGGEFIGFKLIRQDGKRAKALEILQSQFRKLETRQIVEMLEQRADTIGSSEDDTVENRMDRRGRKGTG